MRTHTLRLLKFETSCDQKSCARPLRDDGRATVRGGRGSGLSCFETRGIAALPTTRVEDLIPRRIAQAMRLEG
jgi:hypothetical protein